MTPILQQHARRILACSDKSSSFRFYATLWSPKGNQTLQSRIKAALDQKAQLIPVPDPWSNISGLIRNLPDSNRFSQALQASRWVVFAKDYAARLHLIEIVLGLDKAEKFFQSIPAGMRDYSVYSTLVTSNKRFEVTLSKAESTFKKMRELGFLSKPSSSMMSLYSQLEKRNMVDKILYEMEENKVKPDNVTANHTLNVYTAISYVKAMEIFMRMWVDKVDNLVEMAKTYVRVCSEMYGNVARSARQVMHTLWDEFKSSLSKLGDVDGAEDTYGEWKEIEHDVRELVTQKSMMLLHVLNLLLLLNTAFKGTSSVLAAVFI